MASTTVTIDGSEVRRRRIHARLLQHELASRVGVVQSYLSKIECGHKRAISIDTLRRLERELGRLDVTSDEGPSTAGPA